MCSSWVIPSVAVVGVEFNSVVGSKVWDFCEGDLVVVYVDWGLGGSSGTCANFVESIVGCLNCVKLLACHYCCIL